MKLKIVIFTLVTLAFAVTANAQWSPNISTGPGNGSALKKYGPKLPSIWDLPPNVLQDIIAGNSTPAPERVKKRSEYPGHWIVAEFEGQKITNADLEKFIENSRMSDSQKIELFVQAGKDFEKYKQLKADWIYEWWRPALKQLVYYKMLENMAKKEGKERRAFKTTEKEYYEIVDKSERDILKTQLDTGKGINYARTEFAKFLVNNNYPYKESEKLLDIYFRWFKSQEMRIKEQIRVSEVNKAEFFEAHPKANPMYILPLGKVYDLNKEAKAKIAQLFARQDLNDDVLEKALRDSPLMETLLMKIKTYSLNETSMAEYFTRNKTKFNATKALLVNKSEELFGAAKLERILHYAQVAEQLAQRYQTAEELQTQQKESEEAFLRSNQGNYQDFMMARLYSMATLIKKGTNSAQAKKNLQKDLALALATVKAQVGQDNFYREPRMARVILSDLIGKTFDELLKIDSISDEYTQQLYNMASWILKYDIKKLVANDKTEYEPMIRDYDKFEAQKYLEAYVIQTTFDQNLAKFRTQKLKKKYKWSVIVNPSGEYKFEDSSSINFIFE